MTVDGEPEPQAVLAPLTGAAIFLVAVVRPGDEALDAVRDLCGGLAGLVRAVGFRASGAALSCVTGIGHGLWQRLAGTAGLAGTPRPAGLHELAEIRAPGRVAVSTPGDLLFHIRASRMDLCYELATQLLDQAGDALGVADEVHGFRYFDNRDVIGFVDGTENPVGRAAARAVVIGGEDPEFAGGSYVIVQKYLHDLAAWNALPVEEQELIIGRRKLSDVELADDVKPSSAHNALTTILDDDGEEVQILRDNMPFGRPGSGEHGTYFIGYARSPDTTEQMLRNMFIGSPEGNYDRLLDFSTAVTGGLFFVPSQPLLERLGDGPLAGAGAGAGPTDSGPADTVLADSVLADTVLADTVLAGGTGSLEIGSLRGASPDE